VKRLYKYKKAVIDQVFLGFFLFFVLIGLGATVADEIQMRNEYIKLEEMADSTSKAMTSIYNETSGSEESRYQKAECIAKGIISKTALGEKLLKDKAIEFIWYDMDNDGRPDFVSTKIDGYSYKGFWYGIVGADAFNIPNASYVAKVSQYDTRILKSYDVSFGGTSGGAQTILGTYTKIKKDDGQTCVVTEAIAESEINNKLIKKYPAFNRDDFMPKIVMPNTKDSKASLGLAQGSPPNTEYFLITWGYDAYGSNMPKNPCINIENPCSGSPSFKIIDCNNKKVATVKSKSQDHYILFQDPKFNGISKVDGKNYDHFHILGRTHLQAYQNFLKSEGHECKATQTLKDGQKLCIEYKPHKFCVEYWKVWPYACKKEVTSDGQLDWETWVEYATANGIDYSKDPNDNYIYAIEDTKGGGDRDFNDIFLDIHNNYEADETEIVYSNDDLEYSENAAKLRRIKPNTIADDCLE